MTVTYEDITVEIKEEDAYLAEGEHACYKIMKDHYSGPLDLVLDIGANVGVFSLYAAKRAGQVVAFEPSYENFGRLCLNIMSNNQWGTIVPLPLAIGDRHWRKELFRFAGSSDGQRGITYHPNKYIVEGEVCVVNFTQVLGWFDSIDYLKMDIEGAEWICFMESDSLSSELSKVRFIDLELHDPTDTRYFQQDELSFRTDRNDMKSAQKELISYLSRLGFSDLSLEGKSYYSYNSKFMERGGEHENTHTGNQGLQGNSRTAA